MHRSVGWRNSCKSIGRRITFTLLKTLTHQLDLSNEHESYDGVNSLSSIALHACSVFPTISLLFFIL